MVCVVPIGMLKTPHIPIATVNVFERVAWGFDAFDVEDGDGI
jgi:hypothetical protein